MLRFSKSKTLLSSNMSEVFKEEPQINTLTFQTNTFRSNSPPKSRKPTQLLSAFPHFSPIFTHCPGLPTGQNPFGSVRLLSQISQIMQKSNAGITGLLCRVKTGWLVSLFFRQMFCGCLPKHLGHFLFFFFFSVGVASWSFLAPKPLFVVFFVG